MSCVFIASGTRENSTASDFFKEASIMHHMASKLKAKPLRLFPSSSYF